jgi:hypothetical protein
VRKGYEGSAAEGGDVARDLSIAEGRFWRKIFFRECPWEQCRGTWLISEKSDKLQASNNETNTRKKQKIRIREI